MSQVSYIFTIVIFEGVLYGIYQTDRYRYNNLFSQNLVLLVFSLTFAYSKTNQLISQ